MSVSLYVLGFVLLTCWEPSQLWLLVLPVLLFVAWLVNIVVILLQCAVKEQPITRPPQAETFSGYGAQPVTTQWHVQVCISTSLKCLHVWWAFFVQFILVCWSLTGLDIRQTSRCCTGIGDSFGGSTVPVFVQAARPGHPSVGRCDDVISLLPLVLTVCEGKLVWALLCCMMLWLLSGGWKWWSVWRSRHWRRRRRLQWRRWWWRCWWCWFWSVYCWRCIAVSVGDISGTWWRFS